MLDERQIKAIEMLVTGDYKKTEVARELNISRQTLYDWINGNKEFVAELDKRLQNIKNQAKKEFTSKLPQAIEEYWKLCQSNIEPRTREKALSNWIDRSLGRIANTVNINEDNTNDDDIDILAVLDEEISVEE